MGKVQRRFTILLISGFYIVFAAVCFPVNMSPITRHETADYKCLHKLFSSNVFKNMCVVNTIKYVPFCISTALLSTVPSSVCRLNLLSFCFLHISMTENSNHFLYVHTTESCVDYHEPNV